MIPLNVLNPFQYQFDDDLLKNIASEGQVREFKKDEIIIDIGQTLTHVPLLLDGNINVLQEDDNGNELLLYVLESGDTCSMSLTCCVAKSKSRIRAIADKDTKVIMIPNDKMSQWFNTNETWRNFILQSYQTRFDEMLETIDTLAFMKMDERLLKYLTNQVKLNANTIISKTHQNIAEDLNTSRVVVSRLLKKLENDHILKLSRNKIEVLEF
ncbi:Crp/Fnr family transcriptional regulator [Subsaximicrobium wynnwilliamsii]|uniref:Crp/Fnr family transcriptional regulator n=1 Tax=Subsaximicrobium wynnwilliamsii TaxID=291179 RepID=A0A5C6ZMQ9_9FLAO|nr:Crp/Fnr family transcriptional regulator [Subsaximicrobium wynnwilliamsii]TXD84930.1 Crp/Fnr family transcriptional regulator [Subsaximicrobium wynnwilliamsii]TXD90601.1 Crp/Fnr family transcriptional regulator [Subsaximicrobium wynnwilliamsii]TXE05075.1 Crp/Fnr family transcriptional regulator [Subsaximicrobium wynnwilliamsii]